MNVSSPASPRKVARLVAALAALSMFGAAGCGQQKAPSQVIVDKQVLEADSLHMARLYAQWDQDVRAQAGASGNKVRGEMPIDLGDDTQYRFLKNRLLASGSSPDNSPQLFERIEKLRKEKKAAIPGKVSRKDMITSTTAAGTERENPWCGHLLPLSDVESSDAAQARFQTFGLVTCFNGSDYAFADVNAFATDAKRTQFRALGTQSLEDYAGAVLETPKLNLDLKANPEELLIVDSVAIAFNEATGESHLSYAVSESSIVALGYQGGGDPEINVINSQHPRELIGSHYQDNPIRTCLERGGITGYLDCDYTSGNYDAATPVKQSFNTIYNWSGYRQPVDNGIFNVAKAGQSIPMKFSLSGNQGLGIIAAGYPKVTPVTCPGTSATVDAIEEYAATTNNGLTYDASIDQYNYVWKTPSTYAGKCYQFNMVLTDGTSHTALFKFTK